MREIKFRGKRLDNGEWVYGSLILIEDTYFIIEPVDFSYNNDTDATAFWFDCTEQEVDPAAVGQFTGLKDRYGKEIYEGDIISDGRRFHVLWDTRDACWTGEMNNDPQQRLDVAFLITDKQTRIIGNIHDNPELLKYA